MVWEVVLWLFQKYPRDLTIQNGKWRPLREKGILSNQWLGFKFIPLSILYLNFFYVAQNRNYDFNF